MKEHHFRDTVMHIKFKVISGIRIKRINMLKIMLQLYCMMFCIVQLKSACIAVTHCEYRFTQTNRDMDWESYTWGIKMVAR
jgi:hypothetical protein